MPFRKLTTYVSEHHYKELYKYAENKKIPKSRLLAIALDNEMSNKNPFDYNLGVVSAKSNESDQAKIINYVKTAKGHLGKDLLCLSRQDIGIDDKADLLKALEDLIKSGVIATYKKPKLANRPEEAPGYLCYKLKSDMLPDDKEKRRKQYEKLKKEFEN